MNESAKAVLAVVFIVCAIASLMCWFIPPPDVTLGWDRPRRPPRHPAEVRGRRSRLFRDWIHVRFCISKWDRDIDRVGGSDSPCSSPFGQPEAEVKARP